MGEVLRFVPVHNLPQRADAHLSAPMHDDFETLFINYMVRRLTNSGFTHLSRRILAVARQTPDDGDRSELDALIDLSMGLVGTISAPR